MLCCSRTPLHRTSSQLIIHCTGEKAFKSIPCPSIESTRHREASSSIRAGQILRQGHLVAIANPFSKVADLLCRFPLPTLLCGPEAADVGDLMRLWARSGVSNRSVLRLVKGSWKHISTPRMTRCFTNGLTQSQGYLMSLKKVLTKKRQRFSKLPPALPNSCSLPHVIHVAGKY